MEETYWHSAMKKWSPGNDLQFASMNKHGGKRGAMGLMHEILWDMDKTRRQDFEERDNKRVGCSSAKLASKNLAKSQRKET